MTNKNVTVIAVDSILAYFLVIGSSGKGELTVQLEHVLSARKNFQKMNMRNKQNMEAL